MTSPSPQAGPGRARQDVIYRAGITGAKPRIPTNFTDLEARAQRRMSGEAWAYVYGGAGEGATMAANRSAFDRWQIVPRMLRDVSRRSLATTVLDTSLQAPVLLAPVGAAGLVTPGADVLIGKGAAAAGIPYIFSNQGSAPMEDTARAMGTQSRWFQLYWGRDEGLVDSFIGRAEAMGAEALVVTLDTTMLGWRPWDLNIGSLPFSRGIGIAQYTSDPRFMQLVADRVAAAAPGAKVKVTPSAIATLFSIARNHPGSFRANLSDPAARAAVETFLEVYSNPALTWDHIATLRDRTTLPVVLKGILHPDDARRAFDSGVDAVMVSNHGGRQVDGAIGSLDALVAIREAVGPGPTVLLDSGIRSGADVFKALALGANAVTLGRPHIYGLALDGADGVRDVIANVIGELDLTMGLSGVGSIAEIDRDCVRRAG